MKKVLSVIMALIMSALVAVPSISAKNAEEKLYNVYGDGMLFQQKKEAVLAGTGASGKLIECSLKNSNGAVVAEGSSKVKSDGTFNVSFTAPEGSYEEYTIELKSDGTVFDTLKNVVFGELWLSGGQSNMQLELCYSSTGKEMIKNNIRGSKNVRYFYSAPSPLYNGNINNLPLNPQKEIPDCCWFDGTDDRIFNMSGVGFFFAEKLQKEIGMPVGLLSGSLGGSSITAWLPREYAEKDKKIVKALGSSYYSEKKWKEDGSLSVQTASFGMYNKKIAPLGNFRPAGMIWYQGESDSSWDYGRYTTLFDALQKSYSELFGYENEEMPVVLSALCDFSFGNINASKLKTSELGEIQAKKPQCRSIVSVSDIPLTYDVLTATVHPVEKKPVGERMAYAAQGLVYKKDNCVSAPVIKSSEIKDGAVYITYNNCGDTLKAKGDRIYGFTICGKDGVYVPAEAEIVSKDTVKVYSENITSPKAAMYANGLITGRCNLYAFKNGEYVWPVMPTVTNWKYTDNIWTDFGWTDCDTDEIWREESLTTAGSYKIWEADGAEVKVSEDAAFYGNGGLKIAGQQSDFSVSPITTYTDENGSVQQFVEFNKNWMNFKTLSFMVKNSGDKDVSVSKIKIYNSDGKWVSPVIKNTMKTDSVIPADNQWHKVEFSLNTMIFSGKILPAAATRTYLDDVSDFEICFEGENTDLSVDEFAFTTSGLPTPVIKLLGFGPVSIIFNLISALVGLIKILINK